MYSWVDLAGGGWLEITRRVIPNLGVWLIGRFLLNLHTVFDLAKLLHEVGIFFAIIAESRNVLWLIPSAFVLGVLLGDRVGIGGLIFFPNVRRRDRISEWVSV